MKHRFLSVFLAVFISAAKGQDEIHVQLSTEEPPDRYGTVLPIFTRDDASHVPHHRLDATSERPEVEPTHDHSTAGVTIFAPVKKFFYEGQSMVLTCVAYGSFGLSPTAEWFWRDWKDGREKKIALGTTMDGNVEVVETEREYISAHQIRHYSTLTIHSLHTYMNNSFFTCRSNTTSQEERYTIHLELYRSKEVGDHCDDDEECVPNAVCSHGFCACKRFFSMDSYGHCSPRKSYLNEPCIRNTECYIKNSFCDRVCACKHGYSRVAYPYEDKCVQEKNFLDPCLLDSECQAKDANSVCSGTVCKCALGYAYVDGKCWRKVWLGDVCSNSEECSTMIESSLCRNISGDFKECSCAPDYVSHGLTRCVPIRIELEERMLRIVFLTSIVTLVILAVSLCFCACKSARFMALHRKGRQYRDTIMDEQHLSICKRVPLKSRPDLVFENKCELPISPIDLNVSNEHEQDSKVKIQGTNKVVNVSEIIPFIKEEEHQYSEC